MFQHFEWCSHFCSQKKDRLRQEQLARERIAARRKKKANEVEKELREKEQEQLEDIGDKENLVALQVRNNVVYKILN